MQGPHSVPFYRQRACVTRGIITARNKIQYIFLVSFAFLLLYQVVCKPIVGIANNGDFERLMCESGIYYPSNESFGDKYYSYINTSFNIGGRLNTHFFSSESLFIKTSLFLNSLFSKSRPDRFDIRFMGILQAILLLAGAFLVVRACRTFPLSQLIVLALCMLFIFGDVGYVAYLNSFYSEPSSLIFFLLSVGLIVLFIREGSSHPRSLILICLLLFATVAGFVTSKMQNGLYGFLLAAYLYWISDVPGRNSPGVRLLRISSVLLVLITIAFILFGADKAYYEQAGVYNMVFNEIAPNSPHPVDALQALGLDKKSAEEFVKASGTNAYDRNSLIKDEKFKKLFFAKVGYKQILEYYLLRPFTLWDLVKRRSELALIIRPPQLGNFAKSAGFPPGFRTSAFGLWSKFKKNYLAGSVWFLIGFFGLNVVFAALKYRWFDRDRADRSLSVLHLLVVVMAVMQYMMVILGDANVSGEILKHFFLFNILFDFCVITMVLYFSGVIRLSYNYLRR